MIYTSYYGQNSTAVVHSGVSYEATLFCCIPLYGGLDKAIRRLPLAA